MSSECDVACTSCDWYCRSSDPYELYLESVKHAIKYHRLAIEKLQKKMGYKIRSPEQTLTGFLKEKQK